MSETAACRPRLAPYCQGTGLDLGFGGDAIVPTAITMDQVKPYTNVGGDTQILRGDARCLQFICDECLDYVFASHLIEDFVYTEQLAILLEWRRVLKPGGHLVIFCPDEKVYSAHCQATGQDYNQAHKERDFSLATFKERVLFRSGLWEVLHEIPLVDTYSWDLVARKL